ncbi:MAG: SPOR domain-containing protein [Bacteroidota bacterium]|nr:SPOR domain-containing protein [Bacteroidota bacterium]
MTRTFLHRCFLLNLFVLFVVLLPYIATAQTEKPAKGSLTMVADDRVEVLVSKHIQVNESMEGIEGYRIQLFFDSGVNSKARAQSIYSSFMAKYPNMGAYLTFKAPNYKVRVGDFRTRLDAQRSLNEIVADYPNAWITDDIINLPKVE